MQKLVNSDENWDLTIRPKRGLFEIPLKELWYARELIGTFVWRDFISIYKQTALGPLWYLIQPLLITFTYFLVFGKLTRLSTEGAPPLLFYMSGTVLWSYFSSSLTKTSSTFVANAGLFTKVYFPRLAVPISIVLSNLVTLGIQLGLLVIFLLGYIFSGAGVRPNHYILLLPFLIFLMAGLSLGLGIIVAALTTRYRDLQQVIAFGTQLLMFITPVIYPISSIPSRYQALLWLNPISPIIESFRFGILGVGSSSGGYLIYSFAVMLVIFFLGLILFTHVESTSMDTI